MLKYYFAFCLLIVVAEAHGQSQVSSELSLQEAIEISLNNNYKLITAGEQIQAAKGRFWKNVSLPMPELTMDYEYIPAGKNIKQYNERTIGITQSLEFPTNYFLRGSMLSKEEDAAGSEYQNEKNSVIAEVKTAYYHVLAKEQWRRIAEENLSIADEFYKKAETRNRVGEGTHIEKLTAKVQLAEARNNLEMLKKQVKNAYAELNYILGYGRENNLTIEKLSDTLAYVPLNFKIEESYSRALQFNPLIKIGKLAVEVQSLNKKLSKSSFLPNLTFGYFRQKTDGNSGFYGATFGLSVPLWFMFDQRGQISEANANFKIAETDLNSVIHSVNLKINQAFTDWENSEKQIQFYNQEILPQAHEIYRVALKSYETGELSYLEYLQSKQTLLSANNNYIQALLDYNLAMVSLEQAVGCGVNR